MSMSLQTVASPKDVHDSTRGFSWRRQVCRVQRLGLSIAAALPLKRARAAIAEGSVEEDRKPQFAAEPLSGDERRGAGRAALGL